MKICFLDNSNVPYTYKDLNSKVIRGAEDVVINLSNELSLLGHEIDIFNNCIENCVKENVKWHNIKHISKNYIYDIAITNNDIRLFKNISARKYVAISHSIQTIEKFIRKGQLFSYLKYKPKIVLLSDYHHRNRNSILKIFGIINLEWAVNSLFLETQLNNELVENRAIFTSRSDRNLEMLINIWKEKIYPRDRLIKLYTTPSNLTDNKFNIFNRNFDQKEKMLEDILKSKVLLVPGHKGEVYCIAAEEARELCIPIITLGIGSLKERVQHGITGFVAKNAEDFANYTLKLINDKKLWNSMRDNLIKLRGTKKWNDVATNLLNQI